MDTLQRLHQLLDERGWSEYRLAKNCGLSNSTIANIYHRNTVPSITTLEAICAGFGISLSQFFAEGEMVELTPEGEKEIHKYKNNYADATKPLSSKERNWSAWDMGILWIGMIVSIAVYQVASGLIVSGMSWAQALLTIVLGHTLVMIFAVVLGHFGTKYGLGYPMLSIMVFGSK